MSPNRKVRSALTRFGCWGWFAILLVLLSVESSVAAEEGVSLSLRGDFGGILQKHSIYVKPDEFILTLSCADVSCSLNEVTGPSLKAVRVEGWSQGKRSKPRVPIRIYIPRSYKTLYLRGVGGFGNDYAFDLTPFDKYVKARTGVEGLQDSEKPKLSLSQPQVSGALYRTEDLFLTLEGRATDNLGVLKTQVNGEPVRLRDDGSFKYRLRLKMGKNSVVVRVTDVNDNETVHSFTAVRDEIVSDTQFSDVDFPAKTGARASDAIAVVIGIEKYRHAPSAPHAVNDAEIVREYLVKRFGFERGSVLLRLDEQATKGEFERIFGPDGWLARQVTKDSQVTVYYSGHGAPDPGSGSTFLVPHDIDPSYPATGYPVSELYARLEALPAASMTLVLDACFSGTSRSNESLLEGARPLVIEVEETVPQKKLVVLAASTGSQISSADDNRLHGLFTYYFLKGLAGDADADNNQEITVGEMGTYVGKQVPPEARRMGREQTPVLHARDPEQVLFRY